MAGVVSANSLGVVGCDSGGRVLPTRRTLGCHPLPNVRRCSPVVARNGHDDHRSQTARRDSQLVADLFGRQAFAGDKIEVWGYLEVVVWVVLLHCLREFRWIP